MLNEQASRIFFKPLQQPPRRALLSFETSLKDNFVFVFSLIMSPYPSFGLLFLAQAKDNHEVVFPAGDESAKIPRDSRPAAATL